MAYAAPHYGEWGSLMSGGSGVVGALASLGTLATNIVSLRQNTRQSDYDRARIADLERRLKRLESALGTRHGANAVEEAKEAGGPHKSLPEIERTMSEAERQL